MYFAILLHGKLRSLECSLRRLSSPANSKKKTSFHRISMYCGYTHSIHVCSLLLPLCSDLGVERTKFFTFCIKKEEEKKKSQEYHQPFSQCKCVLSVEQQHSFGIHSYCFLLVCFLVLGGLFFLRKKPQLFILNVVELPLYLVCVSFVDILTHSLSGMAQKIFYIFMCDK